MMEEVKSSNVNIKIKCKVANNLRKKESDQRKKKKEYQWLAYKLPTSILFSAFFSLAINLLFPMKLAAMKWNQLLRHNLRTSRIVNALVKFDNDNKHVIK